MNYKTLKKMDDEEFQDYIDELSEEEVETLYDSIVSELSRNKEIASKVYWGNDYYFTFFKGNVYYMLSYDDCWPKAGSSPDVVTGLSEKDKTAVDAIIGKFGNDEIDNLFDQAAADLWFEYYEHYPKFEDDDMIEYLSDEGDDDFPPRGLSEEEKEEKKKKLSLYKDLLKEVKKYKDSFEKTSDFYDKYRRIDLEYGILYYGYEGMWIELQDNVIDCGDDPKDNDEMLEFLEYFRDLENRIVNAER